MPGPIVDPFPGATLFGGTGTEVQVYVQLGIVNFNCEQVGLENYAKVVTDKKTFHLYLYLNKLICVFGESIQENLHIIVYIV